jgi:hypothetical protein
VNHYAFAVLASVFVAVSLGFVWYAPFGLGDAFLEALGGEDGARAPSARPIAGGVGALALAGVALAVLIDLVGARTVGAGARLGGAAAALVAAVMLSDYLMCGRSLRLYAIQASYRALFLVLMGIAFAARP